MVFAVPQSSQVVPPAADGAKPAATVTDGIQPVVMVGVAEPVVMIAELRRLSRRLRRCVAEMKPAKVNDKRLLVERLRG